MMGVMLQWAVFVKSANEPVFVNLHQRDKSDLWPFKNSQNTLGNIKIHMAKNMIHTIMNPHGLLIILILFKSFYL